MVLIANVQTGAFWGSHPSAAQLAAYLERGALDAGPAADWSVGHFVALVGLERGTGGRARHGGRHVSGARCRRRPPPARRGRRRGARGPRRARGRRAGRRAPRERMRPAALAELWDNGSPLPRLHAVSRRAPAEPPSGWRARAWLPAWRRACDSPATIAASSSRCSRLTTSPRPGRRARSSSRRGCAPTGGRPPRRSRGCPPATAMAWWNARLSSTAAASSPQSVARSVSSARLLQPAQLGGRDFARAARASRPAPRAGRRAPSRIEQCAAQLGLVHLRDAQAAPVGVGQPVALEAPQRLAHGRPADAEPGGQRQLRETRARADLTRGHERVQPIVRA